MGWSLSQYSFIRCLIHFLKGYRQKSVSVLQESSQRQGREDMFKETLTQDRPEGCSLRFRSGHVIPLLRVLPWLSVAHSPQGPANPLASCLVTPHCFNFPKRPDVNICLRSVQSLPPIRGTLHSSIYLLLIFRV